MILASWNKKHHDTSHLVSWCTLAASWYKKVKHGRILEQEACNLQSPIYIICWWRSAACWASSTTMASSKNLLMLTSSLIPCKRWWKQLKTLICVRLHIKKSEIYMKISGSTLIESIYFARGITLVFCKRHHFGARFHICICSNPEIITWVSERVNLLLYLTKQWKR